MAFKINPIKSKKMSLISTKYAFQYTLIVTDTVHTMKHQELSFNKILIFNNVLKSSRIMLVASIRGVKVVSNYTASFIFSASAMISNLTYGKWRQ